MNTPDIIEIDHLSFQYDGVNVLEDISFSIPKGAFLGLVGPNGSGKSTLIKCLLGLQKPSQGAIRLFGKDQRRFKERSKIGYVSQKANSFNSGFPATVFEVVSTGLTSKLGLFRFMNAAHKQKVKEAVEAVGMSEFLNRNIGELSGGQQQRLCIARTIAVRPDVILLDEPTSALDPTGAEDVLATITRLVHDLSVTVVMAEHRIERVLQLRRAARVGAGEVAMRVEP